ncbi:MAG: hypothetical protein GY913_10780, partial [Proteobacteria bacterium]|nr:hypothetical protein [Pseudomonadota bacterium]
ACDGVDDDCDGETDEGCDCLDGELRPCGPDLGACRSGSATCLNGAWGPCVGALGPGDETCDGTDEDCDGETDEGLEARLCALQLGLCAGAVQACGGEDGWLDCEPADYGPEHVAEEGNAHCDGLDNDCDGESDEACACAPGAVQRCGLERGECEAGEQLCGPEGWGLCEGGTAAVAELCDGLDNDCDGAVDESAGCEAEPDAGLEPDAGSPDSGPLEDAASDVGLPADAAVTDALPQDASAPEDSRDVGSDFDAGLGDAAPAADASIGEPTPAQDASAQRADDGLADAAVPVSGSKDSGGCRSVPSSDPEPPAVLLGLMALLWCRRRA